MWTPCKQVTRDSTISFIIISVTELNTFYFLNFVHDPKAEDSWIPPTLFTNIKCINSTQSIILFESCTCWNFEHKGFPHMQESLSVGISHGSWEFLRTKKISYSIKNMENTSETNFLLRVWKLAASKSKKEPPSRHGFSTKRKTNTHNYGINTQMLIPAIKCRVKLLGRPLQNIASSRVQFYSKFFHRLYQLTQWQCQ